MTTFHTLIDYARRHRNAIRTAARAYRDSIRAAAVHAAVSRRAYTRAVKSTGSAEQGATGGIRGIGQSRQGTDASAKADEKASATSCHKCEDCGQNIKNRFFFIGRWLCRTCYEKRFSEWFYSSKR